MQPSYSSCPPSPPPPPSSSRSSPSPSSSSSSSSTPPPSSSSCYSSSAQFIDATGCDSKTANFYLEASHQNVNLALESYFLQQQLEVANSSTFSSAASLRSCSSSSSSLPSKKRSRDRNNAAKEEEEEHKSNRRAHEVEQEEYIRAPLSMMEDTLIPSEFDDELATHLPLAVHRRRLTEQQLNRNRKLAAGMTQTPSSSYAASSSSSTSSAFSNFASFPKVWQMVDNDLDYALASSANRRALLLLFFFHPQDWSSAQFEQLLASRSDFRQLFQRNGLLLKRISILSPEYQKYLSILIAASSPSSSSSFSSPSPSAAAVATTAPSLGLFSGNSSGSFSAHQLLWSWFKPALDATFLVNAQSSRSEFDSIVANIDHCMKEEATRRRRMQEAEELQRVLNESLVEEKEEEEKKNEDMQGEEDEYVNWKGDEEEFSTFVGEEEEQEIAASPASVSTSATPPSSFSASFSSPTLSSSSSASAIAPAHSATKLLLLRAEPDRNSANITRIRFRAGNKVLERRFYREDSFTQVFLAAGLMMKEEAKFLSYSSPLFLSQIQLISPQPPPRRIFDFKTHSDDTIAQLKLENCILMIEMNKEQKRCSKS